MIDKEPEWIVLKDPNFKPGEMLMGYKGASYMDSGYFYAPYIPITSTPVVLDPNTSIPKKGILTRYGKRLLDEGKLTEPLPAVKPKVHRSILDPWEVSKID